MNDRPVMINDRAIARIVFSTTVVTSWPGSWTFTIHLPEGWCDQETFVTIFDEEGNQVVPRRWRGNVDYYQFVMYETRPLKEKVCLDPVEDIWAAFRPEFVPRTYRVRFMQ